MFAVIAENDVSQWTDTTGISYHFPRRYSKFLAPGTKLIYYKGGLQEQVFASRRLSPDPHYFGTAVAGAQIPDKRSDKSDLYLLINEYRRFTRPVPIGRSNKYFESIPANRSKNYWRDGVRPIDEATYDAIAHEGSPGEVATDFGEEGPTNGGLSTFESGEEGNPKVVYTTVYERDRKLRTQAVLIHGTTCKACGFDFSETYGEAGAGYVHIHHRVPISKAGGRVVVNPETDLVPLCANCHSIVHRRRDATLSVDALRAIVHRGRKSTSGR